jgi:diguanylate cyclase (GGDEF)-like protein
VSARPDRLARHGLALLLAVAGAIALAFGLARTRAPLASIVLAASGALLLSVATFLSRLHRERAARLDGLARAQAEIDRAVADRTASLARYAGRLERENRELGDLAAQDSVTGVANRRRFEEAFALEWRRGVRSGLPLAIALLDVDDFKAYNDTRGHQMGDSCLRDLAQTLTACVHRAGDLVARYGGDEFVVLLPFTSSEDAHRLLEEMRQRVASLGFTSRDSSPVTVSAGLVATVPSQERDPQSVLAAADRCLYEAKRNGKNRVVNVERSAAAAPHGRPVLIVEDETEVRDALRGVVDDHGYPCLAAADGRAALEMLRSGERPGLIVLDLAMPGMNGWEFVVETERDRALRDIPIAIVTALEASDEPYPVPSRHAGTFKKPLDTSKLLAVVQHHCGSRLPERV